MLRRNLKVQPYGRCSVCTLKLSGCHAWQSSLLGFGIIVVALGAAASAGSVWLTAAMLVVVGLVALQGVMNHKRTDQLIDSEHRLRGYNEQLQRAVAGATARLAEANRDLARTNLELIELDRPRRALVADVTHDLRTPLTAIRGAADNLLDGIAGPLLPAQQEYVEIMRDHTGRLTARVNELLEAAHRDEGATELKLEPVDVRALASDIVRGIEPLAAERGLSVEVGGQPATVAADAAKLRRALENLVSNAIKFTEPGGRVRMNVASNGGEVAVSVVDTGCGIRREELPRLFERFYRADRARPGTGLGLSIARELIRLHGGEITVSSEVGTGSEFRVRLPAAS